MTFSGDNTISCTLYDVAGSVGVDWMCHCITSMDRIFRNQNLPKYGNSLLIQLISDIECCLNSSV